jgi:4-amino-4-deoxy-L-arabinose transferase-like glycosyltransferase
MKERNPWDVHRFFFWAILAFAGIVRCKGLSTGLPLHTLYGETDTFNVLIQILRTGDLNPHSFIYPGLAYYLYLPFLYFFYLTGVISGSFSGLMSVPDSSFIFVGRAVSAIFGTATVYLVYRIGRRFSDWIALFAMAILAAIPQHIEFSHMLRPEIPAIFFALLAHEFAFSILNSPKRNAYIWMGLAAGASFSVKYNIGLPLLLTVLVVQWVVRKQSKGLWLLMAVLSFVFIFAVTNPFLINDPLSLFYWVKKVDSLYMPGEDYYGENNFIYYLGFLTRYNYNLPLIL